MATTCARTEMIDAAGCTWENVARGVGDRSKHVGRHVCVHSGRRRHRQGAARLSVVYLGTTQNHREVIRVSQGI